MKYEIHLALENITIQQRTMLMKIADPTIKPQTLSRQLTINALVHPMLPVLTIFCLPLSLMRRDEATGEWRYATSTSEYGKLHALSWLRVNHK